MDVLERAGHLDLGVHDAAQAHRQRRQVAFEEADVADDRDVASQPVPVRQQPRLEMDGRRLLLALEHEPQVDRQTPAAGQERLDGLQEDRDVALVVARPAGEHPAVDDDRIERRRRPLVDRIGRLDVVVAVDDDRRRPGRMEPVGVDDGVAAGRRGLGVVHSDRAESLGQPVGRALAVGGVDRLGRHAGDPQEREVVLETALLVGVEVRLDGVGGGHATSGLGGWDRS